MPLYLITEKSDNSTLPVDCREFYDGFCQHYHDAFEIIVVTAGEMKCTTDERTYILKSGDIVLFNPHVIHSGIVTEENTVYLRLISALSDVLEYPNSVLKSCVNLLNNGYYLFDEYYPGGQEDSVKIMEYIKRLYQNLKTGSPASESIVLCELYGILSVLFEKHYHENTEYALKKRSRQFFLDLSFFMKENYYKPITVKDAAQALFMSTSRFSHLMQQYLGLSFSIYLRQYRIERAMQKYVASGCTIKEIAESVGFTDYCYFSHVFKEYMGVTPSVYFKK
ncbi:MAG: AraC family transcriptional regulator [Clostridia bacterium]|nr:AraC family transcriptional regulator [Clostridia bacterium]